MAFEALLRIAAISMLSAGGAAAGAASAVLVAAGSAQKRGDIPRASRVSRAGGYSGAAGAALALAAAAAAFPSGPAGAAWLLAWATVAGSGGACLLAGLAGKPRPTAGLVVFALPAGLVVAALAV